MSRTLRDTMPRVRKHKLAIAAILSLVLIAPLVGSYFFDAGIDWTVEASSEASQGGCIYGMGMFAGRIFSSYRKSEGGPVPPYAGGSRYGRLRWFCQNWPMNWEIVRAKLLGLECVTAKGVSAGVAVDDTECFIPSWMLVPFNAIAPAFWLWRWRMRRWQRTPGHCQTCGYDLRATPEQGRMLLPRCPECGAIGKTTASLQNI